MSDQTNLQCQRCRMHCARVVVPARPAGSSAVVLCRHCLQLLAEIERSRR